MVCTIGLFDAEKFLKVKNPSFSSYFKYTYMAMMLCGIHPKQTGMYREVCKLFHKCSLPLFMSIVIITIREDIYGSRENLDAVRQVAMLCMLGVAYHKFASLIESPARIAAILDSIDHDYRVNPWRRLQTRTLVATCARTSKVIQTFWCVCVVNVLLAFPVVSVGAMITSLLSDEGFSKAMMCEFYIPLVDEFKYVSPFFEIVYILTAITGAFACAIFLGYDGFNMGVLIHLCCKLDVLSCDLRSLIPSDDSFDAVATNDKLKNIVEEHQLCYRLANDMQEMTGPAHFTAFFLNSAAITFTGYQVMQGFMNGYIPADFLVFFFSSYLHMFLPCYFCNLLVEKSVNVSIAAFSSGWQFSVGHGNLRLRTRLMILMRRAQKPILIRTGIGPVNLEMFTTVVRTSWSYFTLVRSAQQ